MNKGISFRPATFTEANTWVHLAPESFMRFFPHICTIWQTEEGYVLVETDEVSRPSDRELAWWEQKRHRAEEPGLPCGCQVRVRYVRHRGETLCTFWNSDTAFHARLRISRRLMLSAGSLTWVKEAICVHPHDERTVEQRLSLRHD